MQRLYSHGVLVYLADDALGTPHCFTTRTSGNETDNNMENCRRACALLDARPEDTVFAKQVHGSNVCVVTEGDRGKGLFHRRDCEADALVTDIPGIVLCVLTADCTPILLYDPIRRTAGAVHAGWRGTALGIAAKAVEKMAHEYGSRPSDMCAAIGPCICPDCFETDGDVPEAMRASLGPDAEPYITRKGPKWQVDNPGLNALLLARAGLSQGNISLSDVCTMCNPELFWSHRYARGGPRGAQVAMIKIEN